MGQRTGCRERVDQGASTEIALVGWPRCALHLRLDRVTARHSRRRAQNLPFYPHARRTIRGDGSWRRGRTPYGRSFCKAKTCRWIRTNGARRRKTRGERPSYPRLPARPRRAEVSGGRAAPPCSRRTSRPSRRPSASPAAPPLILTFSPRAGRRDAAIRGAGVSRCVPVEERPVQTLIGRTPISSPMRWVDLRPAPVRTTTVVSSGPIAPR
jgi:hypothetical protein